MPTLKEIREKYYISRRELGNLAGVSESTIVRIEDAKNKTTYSVAKKIVEALSKRTGQQIDINSIEGLNLYSPMTDRKLRTKASEEQGKEELPV